MSDRYDLARFVVAQDAVWPQPLVELRAGQKRGHWMWFVFPQIVGLGHSAFARLYAIAGLDEARAYLAHPILNERLTAAIAALMAAPPVCDAVAILGAIDAVKLRSSLTLFVAAADDPAPMQAALDRFYGGERDGETLRRL